MKPGTLVSEATGPLPAGWYINRAGELVRVAVICPDDSWDHALCDVRDRSIMFLGSGRRTGGFASPKDLITFIGTPDADGWIAWEATADSKCPVPPDTTVEIVMHYAVHGGGRWPAKHYDWRMNGATTITAFRIVQPERVEPPRTREVKVCMSNEELAAAIDYAWLSSTPTGPLMAHLKILLDEQARRAKCGECKGTGEKP